MKPAIDLNVDLGEGGACDAELIALATSANIACGGHAGNEGTIATAIECALRHGVAIGAHPGYEDREHFGRRSLDLPAEQIRESIARQLARYNEVARRFGVVPHHVKLHGALYHQADHDPALAASLVREIADQVPGGFVYTSPTGAFATAASAAGLRVCAEGFADRRYCAAGTLVPRGQPGAVIEDPANAACQALEIAGNQRVRSIDGTWLPLPARTLCIHGDGPTALAALKAIRQTLVHHRIRLQPP